VSRDDDFCGCCGGPSVERSAFDATPISSRSSSTRTRRPGSAPISRSTASTAHINATPKSVPLCVLLQNQRSVDEADGPPGGESGDQAW